MLKSLRNKLSLNRPSLMLAFLALLPVIFVPSAAVTVLQSKAALISLTILIAICFYLYEGYANRAFSFPRSALTAFVLAIPFVYAISAIFAGTFQVSFVSGGGEQESIALMALFASLYVLSALAVSSTESWSIAAARALIVGMCAMLAMQLLHILLPALSFGVLTASTSNPFGSWHEVGIVAGLCVFLVVWLWGSAVLVSYWRVLATVSGILSLAMLFIVNMVDVWIVLAVAMLMLGLYETFLSSEYSRSYGKVAVAVGVGVIAGVSGYYAPALYEHLPRPLQVLQVEVRPSWVGTFAIGKESMVNFRTTLLGSGPNSFSSQWSLYKPVQVNTTQFWDVDFKSGIGLVPTTLVSVGLLGLFVWVSLFALLAWKFVVRLRQEYTIGRSAWSSIYLASALYLFCFHVIYTPSPTLTALFFVVLGLAAAEEGTYVVRLILSRGEWKNFLVSLGLIAIVLLSFVASVWTLRATLSDILVNMSALAYQDDADTDRALKDVRSALLIYPKNDRAHRAAVELGLIQLANAASKADGTDQSVASLQVSLQTTIQHGLAAVSINSGDYQNWLALAGMYKDLAGAGVQGAYDNAKAAYEKAYTDNPKNPIPLVQLAQLEISQDNLDAAIEYLNASIRLKPDLAPAYFLRSLINVAKGDIDRASTDARFATRYAPEDALAWYNLGSIEYSRGAYEEVIVAMEKTVALKSDYANALYLLGIAYEKLGRYEESLDALEKVARSNPDEPSLGEVISSVRAKIEEGK